MGEGQRGATGLSLKLKEKKKESGFQDVSRMLDQMIRITRSWSSQGQGATNQQFHVRISSALSKGLTGNRPDVQVIATDLILPF